MKNNIVLVLSALVIVLALAVTFLSYRVVHIENQRYAMQLGMCSGPSVPDLKCLETVQTRTSWLWHLFYGVTS
jgi:hypothetical protein